MELKQYLEMLRRWAWLLILGAVLGAAAGFAVSLYQKPVYQASTRLLATRAASTGTGSDLAYLNDQQLAQTYIQLITTQPVLDAASKELGYTIRKNQLQVQQVGTTQVVQLTVEDNDPGHAAAIANMLVQALIDQNENLQAGRYTATEQSLQSQIDQTQQQIAVLQSQVNQVSTKTVQDQLVALKAQIDPLQREITDLQKDIASRQPSTAVTNRTKVAEDQARIDQIQPLLTVYQQIYSNLVVLGQPSDISNSTSTQLAQLKSTLDLYQQVYINLLSSLETVRLARLQNTPNVVQIEAAAQPQAPVRPRPVTNTLLAGILGLMVAAGIALLVEYLDDTVKTPEDVERLLELSVIGYVAEMQEPAKDDEPVFVVREPRSPVAEAFRSLRTNLEFSSVDKPLRTLLVTSASPNDGKTTIAANLAAIMAQGGKHVILLDADLRKPQLHRLLNLRNRLGFSDLFRGPVQLETVAQRPSGLELAVITSGSLPPNPAELLASTRMDKILQTLVDSSGLVILDSPPALVADIQILASKVDGVVLVVRPGRTHAPEVRATLEQLRRAGARVLGVVFNRIPRGRPYYYGGYRQYSPYYDGGYHYYQGQRDEIDGHHPGGERRTNERAAPRFPSLFRHAKIRTIKLTEGEDAIKAE